MELEPVSGMFKPTVDRRPRVPEPLPVRLVTVDDAVLPAAAGLERQLDAFYVGVLGFARVAAEGEAEGEIAYRAENFSLRIEVVEPPVKREDLRALGVEVASLSELEPKLVEAEVEYTRQKGLLPGEESILMTDPAGNWIEVVDRRGL